MSQSSENNRHVEFDIKDRNSAPDEANRYPTQQLFLGSLANAALYYGTNFVGSQKQTLQKEIDKYLMSPKMRHFFTIDLHYVKQKLIVLIFPYIKKKQWALTYLKNARVIPRYDVNSPDLYIPLMGYLTYVFIAGLLLGVEGMFTPEDLGLIASQGVAWTAAEVILQLFSLYVLNVKSTINYFDLLSYSGYKFVAIALCSILKVLNRPESFVVGVIYFGISSSYFVMKSLQWRLMSEMEESSELDDSNHHCEAYKRKINFILFTGLSHFFQVCWLSSSLDTIK